MAGWRAKRGRPEWHPMWTYKVQLPATGVTITASVEDCDGDITFWHVYEDGVQVASGSCRDEDEAFNAANKVISYGATSTQRLSSQVDIAVKEYERG